MVSTKLEQEGDSDYVTKEYVCEMMKMQESLYIPP